MQPEERQRRIEDYLQKVEFASLDELSERVDASTSTVRRDLQILETKGAVKRTHGGARLVNPRSDEFTFSTRDTHQLSEKESIGRACAEQVQANQSVILDAGTTIYHVARYLEAKAPQIITNSLPIANHFALNNRVEVVVSGGVIYPRLGVLVGPLAVRAFSEIHADVAVMSSGGITLAGISNSHGLLIEIQRAMIQAARKVIFCLDHTKLGRQSLSPLCELDVVDMVVTDSKASPEHVAMLRQNGVVVVVAERDALG
ncbi:MAG: DeoR/GlpR transcriptional regulator [Verrucomicrobia bacterium]|nr:DeoR/GlpR transcriptional regulator [Verrucomicrobiota bacterium]